MSCPPLLEEGCSTLWGSSECLQVIFPQTFCPIPSFSHALGEGPGQLRGICLSLLALSPGLSILPLALDGNNGNRLEGRYRFWGSSRSSLPWQPTYYYWFVRSLAAFSLPPHMADCSFSASSPVMKTSFVFSCQEEIITFWNLLHFHFFASSALWRFLNNCDFVACFHC